MKITPLKNNILILPEEGDQQTESGIIIQSTKKERIAEVIETGVDVTDVKVGDRVGYPPKGYDRVQYKGKSHMIVPESDITHKYD
jgi:chaperonin GroES